MCCCSPCCAIFSSVFTIVQCIFHVIYCIWMISVYTCKTSINVNAILDLFYYTYFYRDSCTPFSITSDVDTDSSIDDYFTIPSASKKAEMTYNFAITFTVLDIAWILSSAILIGGMCSNPSGWRYKVFHLPWLICCLTACVTDATVAVIYGKHATETDSVLNWLQFVGLEQKPGVDVSDYIGTTNGIDPYLVVPSIVMATIFLRLGIWFINVILFLCLLCSVCRSPPDRRGHIHAPPPVQYDIPSSYNTPRVPPNYTLGEAEVQNDIVYSRPYPGSRLPDDSFKKPVPSMNPRNSTEEQNSNDARIKRWQLYYGDDAFDLRVKKPRTSNTLPPSAPLKEQPGYDRMHPMEGERDSNYGEDALRSQLPWSYFQSRNDTGRLRPSNSEVMPPVPVPDYTIKFGGHRERKKL